MRSAYILYFFSLVLSCRSPELKKEKSKSNNKSIETADLEMAEIKLIHFPRVDSFQLLESWKAVMKAIENNNSRLLSQQSFKTIDCQTCKSFPRGTDVDSIPVRHMSSKDFLKFYRDSFLYQKTLQYYSDKYELEMFPFDKKRPDSYIYSDADTLRIYIVRFREAPWGNRQSHNFYFIKNDKKFKFLGLYLP